MVGFPGSPISHNFLTLPGFPDKWSPCVISTKVKQLWHIAEAQFSKEDFTYVVRIYMQPDIIDPLYACKILFIMRTILVRVKPKSHKCYSKTQLF